MPEFGGLGFDALWFAGFYHQLIATRPIPGMSTPDG
jgi:hypothetical protein